MRAGLALTDEGDALYHALRDLEPGDFDRPTGCPPWTVRDLLAHVHTAVRRTLDMLEGPTPAAAEVDAVGYYRPDHRFDAAADAERVAAAQRETTDGQSLVDGIADACRRVAAAGPADRLVTTRHGDAMTLDDFVVTRVVEVAVHGVDLALALDRPPWTTQAARRVVLDLFPAAAHAAAEQFGWDDQMFLAKATGRAPLVGAEREAAPAIAHLTLAPTSI